MRTLPALEWTEPELSPVRIELFRWYSWVLKWGVRDSESASRRMRHSEVCSWVRSKLSLTVRASTVAIEIAGSICSHNSFTFNGETSSSGRPPRYPTTRRWDLSAGCLRIRKRARMSLRTLSTDRISPHVVKVPITTTSSRNRGVEGKKQWGITCFCSGFVYEHG